MVVPTPVEVVVLSGREAGVVEDEGGFSGVGVEFEVDDGVDAWVPVTGAPGLHDALIGDEFNVAAGDLTAELGEGSAWGGIDGRIHAGEGGELLLVEDGLVEALGAGVEVDLVMDGSAGLGGSGGGLLCLGLRAGQRGGGKGRGDACEGVAAGGILIHGDLRGVGQNC